MLNSSLQNTRNRGPRFTSYRHRSIVRGAGEVRICGALENTRHWRRVLLKLDKTIIKLSMVQSLSTISTLTILQAHLLEDICIIM
jgi:hypothetical protein